VATVKRPSLKETKAHAISFTRELHEPHYWRSPDALNLFNLSDEMSSDTPNLIRHFLQSKMPEKLLDQADKDRRKVETAKHTKVGDRTYRYPFSTPY